MNISSNSPMSSYSFDYSAIGKRKSSAEPSPFNANSNNQSSAKQENIAAVQKGSEQKLFGQGLHESTVNSNNVNSADNANNANNDNNGTSAASVAAAIEKESKGFRNLMIDSIAVAYNLAYESEELDMREGGDAGDAIGSANLHAEAASGKEVSNVTQNSVSAHGDKITSGIDAEKDEEMLGELQEELFLLYEKGKSANNLTEPKNSDITKTNNNNDNIIEPIMHLFAQNKESVERNNNKQSERLHEAMIAENKAGKNTNANNREPLDIIV